MKHSVFLNHERKLRNIWWVAVFFLLLCAAIVPLAMLAHANRDKLPLWQFGGAVLLASLASQRLKRAPFRELLGPFNLRWIRELVNGCLLGAALMLLPALFLWLTGGVTWSQNQISATTLRSGIFLFICVAVTEELLFRGFIFQRIIAGFGRLPAQIVLAALFLLTHINNPGMTGTVMIIAGANIFLASILFGLAFIQTKSLALPIGMHFMANWVQGNLLGFGVSGMHQSSILRPAIANHSIWLTGGNFGLEASIPVMVCLIAAVLILYRRRGGNAQIDHPAPEQIDHLLPVQIDHR